MISTGVLLLAMMIVGPAQEGPPACRGESDRIAEQVYGKVAKGQPFSKLTPSGWIVRLVPTDLGWSLQISMKARNAEVLSRLTPPWHFVPNPTEIEGWHFRNRDNTGPNRGSVNAPQKLREFIFSPQVGQDIQGPTATAAPTAEDVAAVRSFGRGWMFIESYELTPPRKGELAAFQFLTFTACLTWPAKKALHPTAAGPNVSQPRVNAGR